MDDFTLLAQRVLPLLTVASGEIARLAALDVAGAQAEAAHYRQRCWYIATTTRTAYARPLTSDEQTFLLRHCDLLAGELPPALTPSPKG